METSYLIPVKTFLLNTHATLQATTSYSHLVPTVLRLTVAWKMNDVVVRDGLELLMLTCHIPNHVLATSDSLQAPYRPVEVQLLENVQVPSFPLME